MERSRNESESLHLQQHHTVVGTVSQVPLAQPVVPMLPSKRSALVQAPVVGMPSNRSTSALSAAGDR